MAVEVRLGGRGLPRRMAAASFPIASTPVRAFGGWYHRVTAVYGTVPQAAAGPNTTMLVPPDTSGAARTNSKKVPVFAPVWSIVRPSLPRVLPWAGGIKHGIPGVTYTPAVGYPAQDQVVTPQIRPRGPIAQGRVTTNPRPMFRWKAQGGGSVPA